MLWKTDRRIVAVVVMSLALVLVQVASFYTPFGGNAIGPRYLAAVIPMLGLAAAYGIRRFPEMGLILSLISIALMGMVTAIAIDPPDDVLTPLQSFYLVRIQEHRFADNLGTLLGLPRLVSMIVPIAFPVLAAWRVLRPPQ